MTTLTFFLSLIATAGLLGGFYFAVTTIFGARSGAARPRFGLFARSSDELAFWVKWDPSVYVVDVYRILFNVYQPHQTEKEFRFSMTLEAPPKKPFLQPLRLPTKLKTLLNDKSAGGRSAIVTVNVRTASGPCFQKDYSLAKLRKLFQKSSKAPKGLDELEPLSADEASVTTLDFEELTARKERLDKLVAAAKAKAEAQKKAKEAAEAKAKADAEKKATDAQASEPAVQESKA